MMTIYYIIPVLIFILIFCGIIFRKQLKLKMIQIKHGRYSYEYVKQFKKYTNKSPFPYCFKDDILPYLRVANKKREIIKNFKSEKPCVFENTSFGKSKNEVLTGKADPDCFNIFKIKDAELRSYGYYKNQFGSEAKAVFFFFDKLFFMGEYIFENSRNIDKSVFLSDLISQNDLDQIQTLNQFYVSCRNNTSLFYYDNGFTITIRYSDLSNTNFREIMQ